MSITTTHKIFQSQTGHKAQDTLEYGIGINCLQGLTFGVGGPKLWRENAFPTRVVDCLWRGLWIIPIDEYTHPSRLLSAGSTQVINTMLIISAGHGTAEILNILYR